LKSYGLKRNIGLDAVRAAAIIFVVFGHSILYFSEGPLKEYSHYICLDGVTIFFVLSGFLISGIIYKDSNNCLYQFNLKKFWLRRMLRTFPVYYFVLIIILTLSDYEKSFYWKYIFFIQNFFNTHPPFFGEAWSLSVEEWFYILFPITLIIIRCNTLSLFNIVLICIIFFFVLSFIFRYHTYQNLEDIDIIKWDLYFRKRVECRFDSLMVGVLGGLLYAFKKDILLKYSKSLFIIGALIILISQILFINLLNSTFDYGLYFCVIYLFQCSLGVLLLFPSLIKHDFGVNLVSRSITHISKISYSVYLTNHTLVQSFWLPFIFTHFSLKDFAFMKVLIFLLSTYAFSTILYYLVELPSLYLREKLVPR